MKDNKIIVTPELKEALQALVNHLDAQAVEDYNKKLFSLNQVILDLETELTIFKSRRDKIIADRNKITSTANFKKFAEKHNKALAETETANN